MWPFTLSNRPEVPILHPITQHLTLLEEASSDLAQSAQALLLRIPATKHSQVMDFPAPLWPPFRTASPTTAATLTREYSLQPSSPLLSEAAAKMLMEVRDFALDMYDNRGDLYNKQYCLTPMDGIFWTWLDGGVVLEKGTMAAIIDRWRDISVREEELRGWLEGATPLKRRVEALLCPRDILLQEAPSPEGCRNRRPRRHSGVGDSGLSGVGCAHLGG